MHGHVSKCVKMHRKPTGGTNENGKHIIAWSGKGERYERSNRHHGDASQMVTFKQGLIGVGSNHTTINPLKVSSMAKFRTIKANTGISIEASEHRHASKDDPNHLIWASMYGR